MTYLFFVFYVIYSDVFFENVTFYSEGVSLFCKSARVDEKTSVYKLKLKDEEVEVQVKRLYFHSSGVSGRIGGLDIEAGELELNGGVLAKNICVSICSLRCPHSVSFGNVQLSAHKEKIKIGSGFLPFYFTTDLYGRSPGISPPTISLSKKHSIILNGDIYFPLSYFSQTNLLVPLEFSLNYYFFSKSRIFVLGDNLDYRSPDFSLSSDQNFGGKNIFSSRFVSSFSGIFGVSSKIFTRRFLEEIPATVEVSSLPFSFVFQQARVPLIKRFYLYDELFFFSDHLTSSYFFSGFSGFFLDYDFFDFGGGGVIGFDRNVFWLYPSLFGNFEFSDFGVLGRAFVSHQISTGFSDKFFFQPSNSFSYFRLYDYLYSDFFSAPYFLSFFYSPSFFWGLVFLSPYFALNSIFYPDLFFAPEFGGEMVLHPFSFFGSAGLWKDSLFFDSGFSVFLDFFSPSFRFFTFGRRFSFDNSLQIPIYLGNFSFSFLSSFFLTNFGYTFSFERSYYEAGGAEGFYSFSALSSVKDFSLRFSFLFYLPSIRNIEPVQFSVFSSYYLKRFCSDIFLNLNYNFTKRGETRLSFGIRLKI
ncbi:hypothetical protein HRbin19_01163 [bacterium HR19]|nr:hypothetical protein HRbin19_01163 [bacterium HR19]